MRILVLLTDLFDAVGGIQTFNRALVKALDEIAGERGWKVTLLVLNDNGGSKDAGRYLDSKVTQYKSFGKNKPAFVAATLRESLNASTIFMGHVHFAPLAVAIRLLHPSVELLLCVFGIEVWRKLSRLQLLGTKRVDRIVSISASTRDQMLSNNKLRGKRFDILPCTLDPYYDRGTTYRSRSELSLPSGRMILSVSRLDALERYKNIDKVIEAMPRVLKEIPDAFYVVVGDGTDRERLERIAKDSGVHEKVIFTQRVSDDLLPSYYQACDVFVLPSLEEGFGIVFLEAMSHAKPCIGVRAGAIPEMLEDGKTGFLAASNDNEALTDHIIRLLNNETMRRAMGESGKDRLDREFSFGLFRERLEKVLCP
jgi:phosphatidyl-myo-inositol dimannoside synthase